MIRCSLIWNNGAKKEEFTCLHRIDQMLCKKDSYEVLSHTAGPLMNKGLCVLIYENKRTPKPIHIYAKEVNTKQTYSVSVGYYNLSPTLTKVSTIPSDKVKIAITGDLDFYSTMLGKSNIDSKWCPLC